MPYLDWKQNPSPNLVEVRDHPTRQTELILNLGKADASLLREDLAAVFAAGSSGTTELRLELPAGWTLFWKRREEGNRLLLARPETGQWVATLALDADLAKKFDEFLADVAPANSSSLFRFSEQGSLWSFSNLELGIRRVGERG